MTTTEAIVQRLRSLPDSVQLEVLDFVEFIASRHGNELHEAEDSAWSDFSLTSAMRGMEDENSPYTFEDLKEKFR